MTFVYDGSWDGYLTAVFDGFYSREREVAILRERDLGLTLFEVRRADTSPEKSARVYNAIEAKLSHNTTDAVYRAWLSRLEGMDSDIFRFLKFAFAECRDVTGMIQHPLVKRVVAAAQAVGMQAHRFLGILRFQKLGGMYVADIEPDYDLLPLITEHFVDRFDAQSFAIRDLRHMRMLLHEGGTEPKTAIVELEEAVPLKTDDDFERLWKCYYKSMTIKERINPNYKLRQNFMPKKFWNHICELSET